MREKSVNDLKLRCIYHFNCPYRIYSLQFSSSLSLIYLSISFTHDPSPQCCTYPFAILYYVYLYLLEWVNFFLAKAEGYVVFEIFGVILGFFAMEPLLYLEGFCSLNSPEDKHSKNSIFPVLTFDLIMYKWESNLK